MFLKKISNFKFVIGPVLASLYPLVFLYAFNIEMLNLRQTLIPLVFAFLLALLVFFLSHLVMKSKIKASLLSTGFLILFWNYDLLYQGLHIFLGFRQRTVLVVALLLFALLLFLLKRAVKVEKLAVINTVLVVVFSFLVAINLLTIVPAEINKSGVRTEIIEDGREFRVESELTKAPDIFLLIFDEYARIDTMQAEWGYDNSDFADHLAGEDFFLATGSRVRYTSTILTMPELLNITHYSSEMPAEELIHLYYNSYLVSYFHHKGYDVYFLDGYSHPLRGTLPDYIEYISFQDTQGYVYNFFHDAFNALLLDRSILGPFEHLFGFNQPGLFYYEGNRAFFEYIKHDFPERESPKFVFAHLWFPHLPYVFDREGNLTNNRVHFFQYLEQSPEERREMYLEQYIYATEIMKAMIEAIKEKNKRDVIIIFQSDHGPRADSAGSEEPDNAFKVLNAIYFPDGDYSDLHEDITPVDTMRVVLNQFFGEDYEMLE